MSAVQKLYKLMQKHKLGDKLSHRSLTARQCEEILSEMLNLYIYIFKKILKSLVEGLLLFLVFPHFVLLSVA